jgi:hypothetical protein
MSTINRDNFVVGSAALAEGTNANTFKTVEDINFVINGRSYHLDAADNLAFTAFSGTSFTALAAKKAAAFFFMISTAGTVTVIQGETVNNPVGGGTGQSASWEWPDRDGYACIGALVVRTDNAATYTFGTTDLSAADVVDVFVNPGHGYSKPVLLSNAGVAS